jgi:hypothetical protein
VPSSAELINARLILYIAGGPDFPLEVHRATEPDWSETATWSKANCETPLAWANLGGDFTGADGDSPGVGPVRPGYLPNARAPAFAPARCLQAGRLHRRVRHTITDPSAGEPSVPARERSRSTPR